VTTAHNSAPDDLFLPQLGGVDAVQRNGWLQRRGAIERRLQA
jgi:hypothetical protein